MAMLKYTRDMLVKIYKNKPMPCHFKIDNIATDKNIISDLDKFFSRKNINASNSNDINSMHSMIHDCFAAVLSHNKISISQPGLQEI